MRGRLCNSSSPASWLWGGVTPAPQSSCPLACLLMGPKEGGVGTPRLGSLFISTPQRARIQVGATAVRSDGALKL
ncbi:hypothetical protein FQA47_012007 [Oryzias melastigma]|uniref:Uncharacterized protein n=1 Tax=Oryzias melastigma TaxID=30732 RepID=A0A834CI92_ORYME|nr:hypothetical protein FQA47_012007 [Oryzias melastigma]